MAFAETLGAAKVTGVPETPTEPAVDVRLTVPVPLSVNPPEKLPALLRLPAEVREIELVDALPTAPASANEPPVAVRLMLLPVVFEAALELKFVAATTLKVPPVPAPELLLSFSEPALLT